MNTGYYDLWDLQGHDDIAIALGNMVIAWQTAETQILFAMIAVTGMSSNQALDSFYRIPTFESRTKFVQAAILEWKPKKYDKEAISKAIAAISTLAATRNNWIHNAWSRGNVDGKIVVFNMRAALDKGRIKPVKAHDIRLHTATVIERARELKALLPDIP
jgi:hypothetical protein